MQRNLFIKEMERQVLPRTGYSNAEIMQYLLQQNQVLTAELDQAA